MDSPKTHNFNGQKIVNTKNGNNYIRIAAHEDTRLVFSLAFFLHFFKDKIFSSFSLHVEVAFMRLRHKIYW